MDTIVIGAGISGLLLAKSLRSLDQSVVVLEKSRGFGGRLASKRVGDATFDTGAQFLTARAPEFESLVAAWQRDGLVRNWPQSQHRLIGTPAMTAVPKALAAGLDIRREHKVISALRGPSGRWTLALETGAVLDCDRLVLTCPVPQALALLDAGAASLPTATRAELELLTYHPCLALLVTLDAPSDVPLEGHAPTEGALRWLADNTKKGISTGASAAITVHASPEFSSTHYTAPEAEVTAALLTAAQPWLGRGQVTSTALHRWKFSEPRRTHPERSVWLPELQLGFAGDAFGGPKVEGAALSGLDLAARLSG
jgi:predicted NAD/FAD-dependent oxidoreductase